MARGLSAQVQGQGSGPRRRNKGLVVTFDEAARREYVSGFRERKQQRRRVARQQQEAKARRGRIDERAQRRLQRKIALGLLPASAEGTGGGDESERRGAQGQQVEEQEQGQEQEQEQEEKGEETAEGEAGQGLWGPHRPGLAGSVPEVPAPGPRDRGSQAEGRAEAESIQVYDDEQGLTTVVTVTTDFSADSKAERDRSALSSEPKRKRRKGITGMPNKRAKPLPSFRKGKGKVKGKGKGKGKGRVAARGTRKENKRK